MTLAFIVRCEGTPEIRYTIPLGQCRAAYPARATDPDLALQEARHHGWTKHDGKDLCPACSRYA